MPQQDIYNWPTFSPFGGGVGSLLQTLRDGLQLPPAAQGNVLPLPSARRPSQSHIEEATEQVIGHFKHSSEYMAAKSQTLDLCEDLYYNRRKDNQFILTRREAQAATARQRNITLNPKPGEVADWRSHQVIASSPIVDQYVHAAIKAIFANSEYYTVIPEATDVTIDVEDEAYPTSRKIQSFLLRVNTDLQYKTRTTEGLRDALVFGTVAGKSTWHSEIEYEPGVNEETGEDEERRNIVLQGPVLNNLNLMRFLPDPDAKTSNCQLWEFIGDRTPVPYKIIKKRFGTTRRPGPYNIGKREFLDRWPDEGQRRSYYDIASIKDDPDVGTATQNPITFLQAWEYHGRIYFSDRDEPVECVATLVTDLNTEDPSGGILIRLQEKPVLKMGCRPYLVYHFIPQAAPLGMGIIEANLDLIWLLSHSINLFIDAVRILSVPMYKYRVGRPFATEHDLKPRGDLIYPGMGIPYSSSPDEVQPFSFAVADLRSLVNLIQYLEKMLEKRTAVSDASRGLSQTRKTASEFVGLVQQAQQPLESALVLFKEAFLDPFGKLALVHCQKRLVDDQTVWLKGGTGTSPVPTTLTLQEIQTGSYRVEAVLDAPQQAKMARAMAIVQTIPILEKLAMPLLLLENKFYKRAGLVEALLRYVDITDIAPVLESVDEATKQQLLMMMGMGQQQTPGPGGAGMPVGAPGPPGSPSAPGPQLGRPIQPQAMPGGKLPPQLQELVQSIQNNAQQSGPVPVGMSAGAQ